MQTPHTYNHKNPLGNTILRYVIFTIRYMSNEKRTLCQLWFALMMTLRGVYVCWLRALQHIQSKSFIYIDIYSYFAKLVFAKAEKQTANAYGAAAVHTAVWEITRVGNERINTHIVKSYFYKHITSQIKIASDWWMAPCGNKVDVERCIIACHDESLLNEYIPTAVYL